MVQFLILAPKILLVFILYRKRDAFLIFQTIDIKLFVSGSMMHLSFSKKWKKLSCAIFQQQVFLLLLEMTTWPPCVNLRQEHSTSSLAPTNEQGMCSSKPPCWLFFLNAPLHILLTLMECIEAGLICWRHFHPGLVGAYTCQALHLQMFLWGPGRQPGSHLQRPLLLNIDPHHWISDSSTAAFTVPKTFLAWAGAVWNFVLPKFSANGVKH